MHKGRQEAPCHVPSLVKSLASMLGFMEFIAEDELQEPDGGIYMRPLASVNPKTTKTSRVVRDMHLWRRTQQDPTYCVQVRAHPWRASMADEMENLPEKMSEKVQRRFPSAVRGVTPVAALAARRSGG